jgi:hypothetical protein
MAHTVKYKSGVLLIAFKSSSELTIGNEFVGRRILGKMGGLVGVSKNGDRNTEGSTGRG